jgi:hypothetical protein
VEVIMLKRLSVVVLSFALAGPAFAQSTPQATVTCKDGSTSKSGRGACSHHGGVAKAAAPATTPAPQPPPAGMAPTPIGAPPAAPRSQTRTPAAGQPTARCKDGSVSYSKHHTGSCSHHGGVAEWL